MKKILITGTAILSLNIAKAQDNHEFNGEIFRGLSAIFVMLALMVFILAIIKAVIQYRLRNKIVDKGISDQIATSVLQPSTEDGKNLNVKWFALLAGLGMGLLIVNYTKPLGIHSLAIMAFSISLSFLGYYLFLIWQGKRSD